MKMRVPHELELSSMWPCEELSQQRIRKPIPLWWRAAPKVTWPGKVWLKACMLVTLPYLWVSTNAGFPYNDIMHKWQTHAHCYYFSISHLLIPLIFFSPNLKNGQTSSWGVHSQAFNFLHELCNYFKKKTNSIFTMCQGKQSTVAVLFPTQAHYYETVKGPDSKARLKGVSALPRERLIHPHRAHSVSRNPGVVSGSLHADGEAPSMEGWAAVCTAAAQGPVGRAAVEKPHHALMSAAICTHRHGRSQGKR